MADLTNKYNTKLSKEDEAKFQQWAADNNRLGDLTNYDMRGWWKQNAAQDAAAQGDARGHFTDEFKKPNHPTFSDESMYHGVDGNKGGTWGTKDGKDTFTPSKTNLDNMSAQDMKDYFATVEPDAQLMLPQTRSQKWYDNSTPPTADAVPAAPPAAAADD